MSKKRVVLFHIAGQDLLYHDLVKLDPSDLSKIRVLKTLNISEAIGYVFSQGKTLSGCAVDIEYIDSTGSGTGATSLESCCNWLLVSQDAGNICNSVLSGISYSPEAILYEVPKTGNTNFVNYHTTAVHAQSFTILGANNQRLTKIAIQLRRSNAPTGSIEMNLYANDTGDIPGALIATASLIDVSTIGTDFDTLYDFVFPAQPILSAGAKYWYVVDFASGATFNASNTVESWFNTVSDLPNFERKTQNTGGGSFVAQGLDFRQRVYTQEEFNSPSGGIATVTIGQDLFMQYPGLDLSANRIAAQNISLNADGSVAYVFLNTSNTPQTLTVITGNIASAPTGPNVAIIARRIGSEVWFGHNNLLRLSDGECGDIGQSSPASSGGQLTEKIAMSIGAGQINTFVNVPLVNITNISDVTILDQSARWPIEIEWRLVSSDSGVEIRSNRVATYTVIVEGY
jgi:hypothetical protein